ncbi:o-succinylbenzoate synthase [Bacteroidota bacterium]
MYTASYIKYCLNFRKPAGTSRGILQTKDAWFVCLEEIENPGIRGIGECPLLPGLSVDDTPEFEKLLQQLCEKVNKGENDPEDPIPGSPSIQFGFETAFMDLNSGGERILFPSAFTLGNKGIPINGLIWMGDKKEMLKQVHEKIEHGYSILKLKVGAIDFQEEFDLIKTIRSEYRENDLEIRLDANGAWEYDEAGEKLRMLSEYSIHSLEQPIKAGQMEEMAALCSKSPIPIALDEELSGVIGPDKKKALIETIRPAYIILKPGLLGGIQVSQDWIMMAEELGIGWWVTSALESNIGLNAIAQWTAILNTTMPQGLGTGSLYTNNIPSPLQVIKDRLFYQPEVAWDIEPISY